MSSNGNTLYREVTRWIVLAVLGLLVIVVTAMFSRDAYSRNEVDALLDKTQSQHDRDMGSMQRELDYIRADVQWLVRKQGGVPSAEADKDNHSP